MPRIKSLQKKVHQQFKLCIRALAYSHRLTSVFYGLFNGIRSSDYIMKITGQLMNNEMERVWKEVMVA
jgi:hypothetical protein